MTVAAGTAAINIIYEGLLLMVLSIMMKKKLLLKNITSSVHSACGWFEEFHIILKHMIWEEII